MNGEPAAQVTHVVVIEGRTLAEIERDIYEHHVRKAGSIRRAAKALGIANSTLADRMARIRRGQRP